MVFQDDSSQMEEMFKNVWIVLSLWKMDKIACRELLFVPILQFCPKPQIKYTG